MHIPQRIDLYLEIQPGVEQYPYPTLGNIADATSSVEKAVIKNLREELKDIEGDVSLGSAKVEIGKTISINGVAIVKDGEEHLTDIDIYYEYKLKFNDKIETWVGESIKII